MKTIICARNYHWALIAYLLKRHFETEGHEVCIATLPDSVSDFRDFAGYDFGSVVTFEELRDTLKVVKEPVHLVLHHHKMSINDISFLTSRSARDMDIRISLFADGFNNLLLHAPSWKDFFSSNASIAVRNVFSFDVPLQSKTSHLPAGTVSTKLSSSTLADFYGADSVATHAKAAASQALSKGRSRHRLLVALRPWGDPTFQAGRFSFEDAIAGIASIIESLAQRIEQETQGGLDVIIRSDSRAADLSAAVLAQVKTIMPNRAVIDLDQFWPARLSLEPVAYQLGLMCGAGCLTLCSLDSSLPLTMIKNSPGVRFLMGAPAEALGEFVSDAESLANIKKKTTELFRILQLSVADLPVQLETLDEGAFFSATLSGQ